MRRAPAALLALGLLATGCSDGDGTTLPPEDRPEILAVDVPSPAVEGTVLRVTGRNLDNAGDGATLRVTVETGRMIALPAATSADGERLYLIDADAVTVLGEGPHAATAQLTGPQAASNELPFDLELARELPVALDDGLRGNVHRNEVVVLAGAGFLASGEGTLVARFVGDFVPDGGASRRVDVALPVTLAERFSRARGLVRLTTAIGGGPEPGHFTGRVTLESSLTGGGTSASAERTVDLVFQPPDLYGLEPRMFSLGQLVTVRGAGFLGGSDPPGEATLIRLDGTFTARGGSAVAVSGVELVPRWVDGSAVQFVVETSVVDGALVATAFGAARGTFEGSATPVTLSGRVEVAGAPVPVAFTLGPVRQILLVRYLPGYYDSLSRFGLSSAVDEIAVGIQRRIEDIYAGYNVEVRVDDPTDFALSGYAVLEIGGPDPNGAGLFGYDNTPGKDVGNLRLDDHIGGANALTLADGNPGYGGVFVESYLYWSSHPELSGRRPAGAPDPEPLFDEIFDPVRARPATLDEVLGGGEPDRVDVVRRAVNAFASIIGETAAHEIGHSLGMAQPFGRRDAYHNDFDGDGCLMDSGSARTVAERAGEPGAPRTTLCYDEPTYLDEILGP